MTANRGVSSKFAVGDASPIVAGTVGMLMNILTENVAMVRGIIDANAMFGERSHYANRVREGLKLVGGSFSMHPTTLELAYMTGKILGSPSGPVYLPSEQLNVFNIQKNLLPVSSRILSYPSVYANVGTYTAVRGQPLSLDCSVLGMDENDALTFDAALVQDKATNVLVFHDLVITRGGTSFQVFEFSLTVNNALDIEMVNNRIATAVFPTDRVVSISHPVPEGGFTIANFIDSEVSIVATFSYNNQSAIFTLPVVRYTVPDPVITGRGELRYPLNGIGLRTAGAPELTITIDATP